MFVTTFYSFRGGVGRTMAIVNIGAWLARHGRRVLLVDFDLESPGIPHYALPNSKAERKGVVDYLFEMAEGNEPVSIEDYYFEAFADKGGGRLYVMPAGRASTHVERFEKLNLGGLYQKPEGYLILENLKALWQRDIVPDYVLIDSRTGYNEVAGICTRQLPDAVVATYIPSPQNVIGLKEVVNQIRAQNREGWRPEIKVHFLASSIPLVDDEDGAIADSIEMSKKMLEFDRLLGKVYYIPSASHLKQTVFTLEKEHSTLAQNFADVARALTMENPDDPEGATKYLDRVLARERALMRTLVASQLDESLKRITERHIGNVEVMFRLARVRLRQGLTEDAISLLSSLLETDPNQSEARLLRATLYGQRGENELAIRDLQTVLSRTDLDVIQVNRSVRALAEIAPAALSALHDYPAYTGLDADSKASLLVNIALDYVGGIDQVIEDLELLASGNSLKTESRETVTNTIVLHRIHSKDFEAAKRLLGGRPAAFSPPQHLFNFAIAEWGTSGSAPVDLFQQLLELDDKNQAPTANRLQCYAIAYAALSNTAQARRHLEMTRQKILRLPRPEFSAWTYSTVSATKFVSHIDQMLDELDRGRMIPVIVRPSGNDNAE